MQVLFTPAQIAEIVSPRSVLGSTEANICSIASLEEAAPGDLSFLGNPKYKAQVAGTKASLVLVPADYDGAPQPGQQYLFVENPSVALALVCARLEQRLWPRPAPGIHPTAVVSPLARVASSATVGPLCVIEDGAEIGERTFLQAQAFVGREARIGTDCWVMAGVVVATQCEVGARVRLHPGVVVGADGFGYEFVNGRHEKVPQVGIVVIGDDVEIGANSTFDRARFSRTVIGQGTKIDNLVQIGHNVLVGRHCILCAQAGVSGSVTIEDYVVLAGQVGVAGHLTIGKGAKAGGQAGISSSIPAGTYVNGTPAIPYQLERRIAVLQQKLPDLFKRVSSLEEHVRSEVGRTSETGG